MKKTLEYVQKVTVVEIPDGKGGTEVYTSKGEMVQQIVRCKDCMHYSFQGFCAYDPIFGENKKQVYGMRCDPDWFCKDGAITGEYKG